MKVRLCCAVGREGDLERFARGVFTLHSPANGLAARVTALVTAKAAAAASVVRLAFVKLIAFLPCGLSPDFVCGNDAALPYKVAMLPAEF
jgi:hypothetical protein